MLSNVLRAGLVVGVVAVAACGSSDKPKDGGTTTTSTGSSSGTGGSSTGGETIPFPIQCGAQECPMGSVCAELNDSCCGYLRCIEVASCVNIGVPIASCACSPDNGTYDPATGIATCEVFSCDTTACNGLGLGGSTGC